ncbi:MAG: hypothetical protein ACRDS0_29490 [Pseudonocardiaceae bacterium]
MEAGTARRLAKLGAARQTARTSYLAAAKALQAAVVLAAEDGATEAELARTALVDRMTVRKWLGKK